MWPSRGESKQVRALKAALKACEDRLRDERLEWGGREQFEARRQCLEAERALAVAQGEPYAVVDETLVPLACMGAPETHLLESGADLLLLYYTLREVGPSHTLPRMHDTSDSGQEIALVHFTECVWYDIGENDEGQAGDPLMGRGLEYFSSHTVRDSDTIRRLSGELPASEGAVRIIGRWPKDARIASLTHYVITMKEMMLECVARAHTVTLTQSPLSSALAEAAERLAHTGHAIETTYET